jgi:hypothetical protein
MSKFDIGDIVRVEMPKGVNKRGVVGISVLYSTWPEARFDGAAGSVMEINPVGPYGIPLYLVSFKEHTNKVAVPWHAQWFREEWIEHVEERRKEPVATAGSLMAPSGFGETTTEGST